MRLLLFFTVILPCAGFSSLQWILRYIFSRAGMNDQDRRRVEYSFGITSPGLEVAWQRALHGDVDSKAWGFHVLKDVMSEWVKLDAQRGGKFLSMLAIGGALISLGAGVAIGWAL